MRAWRLAPGSGKSAAPDVRVPEILLQDHEVDTPEVTDDQILVQVRACVLGAPEWFAAGIDDAGFVPGGAALGQVVETGEQARHLLGKDVIIGPEQGCGECDICRRGEPISCPQGAYLGRTCHGTLAEYTRVRARWACALHGDLSGPPLDTPAAALLGREAAWAYAMFARAGIAPGEPVFVLGATVVTRFLVEIAVAKGVRPMVIVDPDDPSLGAWIEDRGGIPVPAAATSVSLDHALAHQSTDLVDIARDAASTHGHGRRPWFVFESSGTDAMRHAGFALAGPGSKLIFLASRALGRSARVATTAMDAVLDTGATIIGVPGAHPDLLPEVVALVLRQELDIESAVRKRSLDTAAALARLDDSPPLEWLLTLPAT